MHILADIGGTNIRIAGTEDLKTFSEPIHLDTPLQYDAALAAIAAATKSISAGKSIEHVMVGIRGLIVNDGNSIKDSPVLNQWSHKPLRDDLKLILNAQSVTLSNDVTQNGIGEAVHGAGKGARIVVYFTVSTGVNGARIVDGRVEPSAQGFEVGGQYLSMGPNPNTLEDLVSGTAISKKYGVHPKELGKDSPVWEELAEVFAYGLHNTILHWSPERVVLGGSMFNEIGIPVDRVAFHVQHLMRKFPASPEILHSSLGDLGGLWGGLVLLRQNLEG